MLKLAGLRKARTVAVMSRTDFVNHSFLHAVDKQIGSSEDPSAHVIKVRNGIADCLGTEEIEDLADDTPGSEFPINGYHIVNEPGLVRVFIVTPGRFCVFEQNIQQTSLSTVFPIERVSRVSQMRIEGRIELTIELDADTKTFFGETQTNSEDVVSDSAPNGSLRSGRGVANGRIIPSSYVLSIGEMDPAATLNSFKAFSRALRNVLGF